MHQFKFVVKHSSSAPVAMYTRMAFNTHNLMRATVHGQYTNKYYNQMTLIHQLEKFGT